MRKMRQRTKNLCQKYVRVGYLFCFLTKLHFRACWNADYRQTKKKDVSKHRQCEQCKEIKPIEGKGLCK
jgi:hypothetical protein